MKNIVCFILAVLMAMLMIGCDSQNVDDFESENADNTIDVQEQQKTEESLSSENTSKEEGTTNTIESTDAAESTSSGDPDDWTGIY